MTSMHKEDESNMAQAHVNVIQHLNFPNPPPNACNDHLVLEVTFIWDTMSLSPSGARDETIMKLHTVNKRYIHLLIYISHWSEDSLNSHYVHKGIRVQFRCPSHFTSKSPRSLRRNVRGYEASRSFVFEAVFSKNKFRTFAWNVLVKI